MASKTLPYAFFTLLFLHQFHFSSAQTTTVVKAAYWFPESGYLASSINSTLFTHLFCAFADLNSTTYQVTVSSSHSAPFANFTATVQQKNPSVKTLLSIGGGNANASTFASMASQNSTRKSFIDSSIKLARSYNFYGLDLDWEYPSSATEMTNFGYLLNEWRAAVANESKTSNKTALLLSAAVFYTSSYYGGLNYPFQAISNSSDWINIMAYDFYGPSWAPNFTAPPAGLYNITTSQISGDTGIKAWIQAVPAKKVVYGIPFYGYAWSLVNANNHGIFAPANGTATAISSDGSITYSQIKGLKNFTAVYNSSIVTNYCYSGTTWIGYDDTNSTSTKVTYAKGKGLLGYFAWHVGADLNSILAQAASSAWGA
ncbi:class V chitinase-like [Castanea sativa]|uniref:class V chitinase-like n=1 Tax=Castanea sativa TaxID=21020 RepID=UPI003F652BBF